MANKPLKMDKVRQILLLLDRSFSERAISRELKISRVTVHRYRETFQSTELDYKSLVNLTDEELDKLVSKKDSEPPVLDPRKRRFLNQASYFLEELNNPRLVGVTRQLLWEEYCKEDPDPYGYSRFCDLLSEAAQVNGATMRFEHVAGEKLEVDFAGKSLHYVDPETGELISCPVLVAALPYSGYGYVEALPNATLPQVIKALNNCLDYFGGVPLTVKSDNMKQWVSKSCRYEPTFPEALEQWASHNRTGLLAARPYRPKDKPTAENHVYTAYLRVYAKIRTGTFTTLKELNEAIREKLVEHHGKGFQKKAFSRREVFLSEEKPALLPLPKTPYQLKHYARAKVQKNYHIVLGEDRHYYSVPYRLIGKQVNLAYCTDHVEVFLELERVALHRRNFKKNGHTTLFEHMPPSHQHYYKQQGWDKDYYLGRAAECGPSTVAYFKKLMESKPVIHQAYQSLVGLVRLAKKHGGQRMEAACQRALNGHRFTYRTIEQILTNNMEQAELPFPSDYTLPENPNVRGAENYKKQFKS